MKKLLLLLCISIMMYNCKKEEPVPKQSPPINKVNDTIYIKTFQHCPGYLIEHQPETWLRIYNTKDSLDKDLWGSYYYADILGTIKIPKIKYKTYYYHAKGVMTLGPCKLTWGEKIDIITPIPGSTYTIIVQ
jgi:hypothetical protein